MNSTTEAQSPEPSPTPLKPPEESSTGKCWRCSLLRLKHKLPADGDWLFSTASQCESCARTQLNPDDLAAQFETKDGALKAFAPVKTEAGRDAILEHAKEWSASIDDVRDTVRDKAKVILGATAFTFAVMSAAIGLLQATSDALPQWAWVLLLSLFFWILLHFVRSLVLSLSAITRDTTETISTHQIIEFASRSDVESKEEGKLQLAAEILAAATRTHRRTRPDVNRVILAQASFVWGLRLLPVVFLTYVLLFRLYPPSSDPKWKKDLNNIEQRLNQEKSSAAENQSRIERSLGQVNSEVERLQAAIERRDELQQVLERRLDAVEAAQVKTGPENLPSNKALPK